MKKYPHGLTLNAVCEAIEGYQRHEDSVPEEGILAAFNTLLGHSDIAEALRSMERTADTNMSAAQALRDDMYHWKERAEAAEAKLAELEKQNPVAWTDEQELRDVKNHGCGYLFTVDPVTPNADPRRIINLFTRPAPSINLAELLEVSANKTADQIYHLFDGIYDDRSRAWSLANTVWDACHVAIMRNIEEAK